MFNLYLYATTPLFRTPGMSAHLFIFCSYQVEVAALQAAANYQEASAKNANVHPAVIRTDAKRAAEMSAADESATRKKV